MLTARFDADHVGETICRDGNRRVRKAAIAEMPLKVAAHAAHRPVRQEHARVFPAGCDPGHRDGTTLRELLRLADDQRGIGRRDSNCRSLSSQRGKHQKADEAGHIER